MRQIAASFWIERLRVRTAQLLVHYDLTDVELVIFDMHGESFGRGAHPASLMDRLAYLAPPWSQHVFARAGIRLSAQVRNPLDRWSGGDRLWSFLLRLLRFTVAAVRV